MRYDFDFVREQNQEACNTLCLQYVKSGCMLSICKNNNLNSYLVAGNT